MKMKEFSVRIRPSGIVKNYYAVDLEVRVGGDRFVLNQLLPENDFESRFEQCLELLKLEVLSYIKSHSE